MNKATLFTAAWTAARKGAETFGGKAREYFAESLRMAYAYIAKREVKVDKAELTTAAKLDILATIVLGWPRNLRKTFAFTFIMDNAERVTRFGVNTRFSDKQAAIVNDMYAKYA